MSGYIYVVQPPDYRSKNLYHIGCTSEEGSVMTLRFQSVFPSESSLWFLHAVPITTEYDILRQLLDGLLSRGWTYTEGKAWVAPDRLRFLLSVTELLSLLLGSSTSKPSPAPQDAGCPADEPPGTFQPDPAIVRITMEKLVLEDQASEVGCAKAVSTLWRDLHRVEREAGGGVVYWHRPFLHKPWVVDVDGTELRRRLTEGVHTYAKALAKQYVLEGSKLEGAEREQHTSTSNRCMHLAHRLQTPTFVHRCVKELVAQLLPSGNANSLTAKK